MKGFKSKLDKQRVIEDYYINDNLDLEGIINDYSNYIETIINYITGTILNEEDKEEIASDVIFIIWKNREKLDKEKIFSSYIAGVTRNVTRDYIKKNRINQVDISEYENCLLSNENVETISENAEEISRISNILRRMKEIDKEIFNKYYYSSKSIKDIAKDLNITEFNVKTRLYRIRKKIRKGANNYEQ